MNSLPPKQTETNALLQEIRQGNENALDDLLLRHRSWIRRVIDARLDPRVRRRIDPSDIVQEVQMKVARRMDDYLDRQPMPFHLWLRQTAYDTLIDLHRRHLKAQRRTVEKEVFLAEGSTLQLAKVVLAQQDPPERQLLEEELTHRLKAALGELPNTDREIVVMRVCEGLSNQDVSRVLGIHPSTGSKQFGRAILRLRSILLRDDSRGYRHDRADRSV